MDMKVGSWNPTSIMNQILAKFCTGMACVFWPADLKMPKSLPEAVQGAQMEVHAWLLAPGKFIIRLHFVYMFFYRVNKENNPNFNRILK